MFRFASSIVLRGGTGTAFPVYTAQAPSCSIWGGPCAARGSSFRVLHKSADSAGPAFCAFPVRVAEAARSLTGAPGCCAPSDLQPQSPPALVGCVRPVSRCDPPGRCQPSRISGSLWLETGGLLQCSKGRGPWGRTCPFPLPPASCLRRGWAGP